MSNPPPVVIEFITRGLPEIQRAIRSIGDVVAKSERAGVRAVQDGARAKERAYSQLVRQTQKWQAEQTRSAERAIKAEVKAAEQGAKAEIRVAEKAAREKERLAERGARYRIREMARAFSEEKRQQEASAKEAAKFEREKLNIRERSAIMAGRFAKKQADEERRAREQAAAKEDLRRTRFADAIVGGARNVGGSLLRGGTALARTALSLGGGFSVQDSLHEEAQLQRNAILFSNSAFQNRPGERRMSAEAIQERSRANAIRTGIDADQLLGASASYGAKSGDYSGGLELQEYFGKLAKGTGANAEDVAKAAGILKVQNQNLSTDEMKGLLLNVVRQGQIGSVEFSDLAKVAGSMTRSSADYAGSQTRTQGKLLGLGQIAMRTAGTDPREAATVLSNLSSDAMKHSDEIGAVIGKDFLNAKGQIADAPEEFIAKIMGATGANPQKLQDLGFGKRSIKMFQALAPVFNEAESRALKAGASKEEANKAGKDAVLADMKKVTDASMTKEELEQNFAEVMKSSAEEFEGAVRELKMAVGKQLLPALKPLVKVLRDLVPTVRTVLNAFVKMAQWAESNPLSASVAILGASIVKEVMSQIVSAKIGDLIKSLLSGGSGGGVVGGAGKVGGALAVVGAGVVSAGLTKEWIDSGYASEDEKKRGRQGNQLAALNLTGALKGGTATPEQQEEAKELVEKLKADLKSQEKDAADPSLVKKVTGAAAYVVDPKGAAEAQKKDLDNAAKEAAETRESLLKLTAALEKNTAATHANTGGAGGSPANPASPNRTQPIPKRSTQ